MAGRVVSQLSKLSLGVKQVGVRGIATCGNPLAFRATETLWAEPMKKKRKIDVNLIVARELKKKRKYEKEIRKLLSKGRILKPVDEIEGTPALWKTQGNRKRQAVRLEFEEVERRALLIKTWTNYKFRQHVHEISSVTQAIASQKLALAELRKESEELYQQAIQIDPDLFPFERTGPTQTPAIKDYESPDGDYKDTTPTFDKWID